MRVRVGERLVAPAEDLGGLLAGHLVARDLGRAVRDAPDVLHGDHLHRSVGRQWQPEDRRTVLGARGGRRRTFAAGDAS